MNYFEHNARKHIPAPRPAVETVSEQELALEIRATIDANVTGIRVQESHDELEIARVQRMVRG